MRLLEPEVTNAARRRLYDHVLAHPGVHLREIERATHLPLGQVLYHLDRLERMGLLASARENGFRRYYDASTVSRQEKPLLAALRHEVPRRVVLALLERPGLAHKELLDLVPVAGSTLTFHLQRLLTAGVLTAERASLSVGPRYALADPALAKRELAYYRASFDDPAVDRFVRALLDTHLS
jgi:predicted transcriptional regulator